MKESKLRVQKDKQLFKILLVFNKMPSKKEKEVVIQQIKRKEIKTKIMNN